MARRHREKRDRGRRGRGETEERVRGCTQNFQKPLIKEHSLNHMGPYSEFKVHSLIKGFWKLGVHPSIEHVTICNERGRRGARRERREGNGRARPLLSVFFNFAGCAHRRLQT